MNEQNPYAAPNTDPVPTLPASAQSLAGPGDRFLGAFMDGLVGLLIAIPIWGALFFFGVIHSLQEMGTIGFGYTVLITLVHFPLFMAVQWKSLKATGQTIGKKMAKTRIVTMDGKKPEVKDLVLKRYGFVTLINIIPVAGGILSLVDALLVFKSDRRTLHDMVAGTQVVKFLPGDSIS